MRNSNFTAWLLIAVGSFLMLNYFEVLEFNRGLISILISLFLSAVFIQRALTSKPRRGIIGATFFISLSAILIAMQSGILPVDDQLGGGLVLIGLGLANLLCYLFTRRKISNIIWGTIFILIGLPFIIGYFQLMPIWLLEDYYTTYWPTLLIFIGLIVLIDGILRKRRQNPPKTFDS